MAQTPQQLGINASTTGGVFKDAAWYNGRQYDAASGTLGDPGQIWSKSVSGTGTMVSKEVNSQSSVAAGLAPDAYQKYLDAGAPVTGYNAGGGSALKSSADVQNLLNGTQNSIFGSYSSSDIPGVQSSGQIYKDLQDAGLLPTTSAPTPPDLAKTYQDLLNAKGVDALSASITDLKAQADALVAQTRTNVSAEKGKPVAQNIVEGRVSVQKTAAQEQLDFINRQLSVKQDELTSALGNIKTIMDFTQQDYSNASDAYNKSFDQAISTINLIHGIQQDQKTDAQRAQDNARANAQILYNSIREGGLDLNSLPPDTQAQLNKLEVQSGLPVGFFQSIRIDPKANIVSTSTNNGVTQVLMRNPDGSISVKNYGTATGGGTDAEKKSYYTNSAISDARSGLKLSDMFKIYQGVLPPNDIYTLYNSNAKKPDSNPSAVAGSGYLANYGVTLFK